MKYAARRQLPRAKLSGVCLCFELFSPDLGR
jgi:hypothetical protein